MKVNYANFKKAIKARLSNKAFSLSLVAFVVGLSIFAYGAVKASSPVDCDDNPIIQCGVYDQNKMISQYNANTNGVKDVYNHFQINGDFSGMVNGTVTKNNEVIVNGTVVATSALTVGRGNMAGSEKITLGGRTFYKRQPSVSFGSSSIPAYVKIVNGEFKWAVLKSCGNPVQGNPTPKPKPPTYVIEKRVNIQNPTDNTDTAYFFGQQSVTVDKGTQVRFVSIIANNNNVDGGIFAYDDLPVGADYVSGTYQVKDASGNIIQTGALVNTEGRRYGMLLNLKANNEIKLDILATYTASTEIVNVACVAPGGLNPQCDDATVKPKPTPPPTPTPSYTCDSLTVEEIAKGSYKLQAKGTVSGGAKITGYIFKVNDNEVYNNSADNYTYSQTAPGTYTVKAYVKTDKGTTSEVAACTKVITIEAPSEKPSYTIKKYVNGQDAQDNQSSVEVKAGEEFEYKVVIKNTSKVSINSIKAWDVLPTGVSYVDGTLKLDGKNVANDEDYFNPSKGVEVKNLAAGKEAIFTFKAKLSVGSSEQDIAKACDANGTFYNNVAKADPAKQGDSDLPESQDPAVVNCKHTPKVDHPSYTIKKYVEDRDAQTNNDALTVSPNQAFGYKVVIENTGDVKLNSIKAWDVLPTGVSYVDGTLKLDGKNVANDEDYFNPQKGIVVENLNVGQKAEFTFQAKIIASSEQDIAKACDANGTFYNNVAKADPAKQGDTDLPESQDPAVVNCKHTPKVDHPSVVIEKEVSKYEVNVGQEFNWYIKVTNNGDIDLKNVVVNDKAPEGTQFISSDSIEGVKIDVNAKSFMATIANLKVGQKVSFSIKAKLTTYKSGDVVNTACVNAPEVNPNEPSKEDACDDAKIKPVEKCTVPGKENLDKNDSNCKEMCTIKGKENLAKNDAGCKDVEPIITKAVTPSATPNTGIEAMTAIGATISLSAAAYVGTIRFRKRG
jgi:uncharacterized repeat protein (TIGR01451 family)